MTDFSKMERNVSVGDEQMAINSIAEEIAGTQSTIETRDEVSKLLRKGSVEAVRHASNAPFTEELKTSLEQIVSIAAKGGQNALKELETLQDLLKRSSDIAQEATAYLQRHADIARAAAQQRHEELKKHSRGIV